MISVSNLYKRFGHVRALDGISFSVPKGQIIALLGPNGAGKTTTMRMMTGFLSPDSGEVKVGRETLSPETKRHIQSRIGYLPEHAPLYPELSVWEHLDFSAEVHGVTGTKKKRAIEHVAERVGLTDRLHWDVSELSKGYRQRVGLAQALVHDPEILILDEPTTGLDPNQIIDIRAFIKELREHKTIILSTHIMQEVEALADHVIMINKGQVVAEGTPETLMAEKGATHQTQVIIKGAKTTLTTQLKKLKKVENIEVEPGETKGTYIFHVFTSENIQSQIAKAVITAKAELLEMTTHKENMESVFHKLTK